LAALGFLLPFFIELTCFSKNLSLILRVIPIEVFLDKSILIILNGAFVAIFPK
jgi:hypothetical protein